MGCLDDPLVELDLARPRLGHRRWRNSRDGCPGLLEEELQEAKVGLGCSKCPFDAYVSISMKRGEYGRWEEFKYE